MSSLILVSVGPTQQGFEIFWVIFSLERLINEITMTQLVYFVSYVLFKDPGALIINYAYIQEIF